MRHTDHQLQAPRGSDTTRSLSARSLIASTLLGTHPPELSGRLLVALGERFGISDGTVRVALSRMVERGELENHDSRYRLSGPALLGRQERQDRSRRSRAGPWDGGWEVAIVVASGRSAPDRADLRKALDALSLAELREGVWMRPDNLERDRHVETWARVAPVVEWLVARPASSAALVGRLWDLGAWAHTARGLVADMASIGDAIDRGEEPLVDGFGVSAAVLRHFVRDPQLPEELWPEDWPGAVLRHEYEAFDARYRLLLGEFFRRHR